MATVSTEHIEGGQATGTRPGRSRRRVGWDLFLVLASGVLWFSAVDHFRNGRYSWGYLDVAMALGIGCVSLGSLLVGRSLEKDFGGFLSRYPRFALVFFAAMIAAMFAWLVCLKHERDQRRAVAGQDHIQATRQVGEMR